MGINKGTSDVRPLRLVTLAGVIRCAWAGARQGVYVSVEGVRAAGRGRRFFMEREATGSGQPEESSNAASRLGDEYRREQRGWYFYDWANSAFSTTVVTVFLGPYLSAVTENAADAGGFVHPLGIPVLAGSFFPYVLSISVLLQVLLLPVTGAVADR